MEAHEPAVVRGIEPSWIRGVRRAILSFYDTRRRALPWRETDDPYRVLVSEVMLQQTRVETVIPYYERWIARFPDIQHLADAPLDDVLHAWAGLGYYSRARNLHRAATVVRERFNGAIPRSSSELRTLPGVGDYTAGAVASIAFGEPAPAVDGNVRRVLSRLRDSDLPPRALHDLAAALVPQRRAGDFNQGLMELGATVCTPRAPRCGRCPVHRHCAAAAAGTQAQRPAAKTRAPVPEFPFVTLVALTPDHVLLARRNDGRLRGMWGFPSAPLSGHACAAIHSLLPGHHDSEELGTVTHRFTHRVETYRVFRVHLSEHAIAGDWVLRTELYNRALSAAPRRIAGMAGL